MGLSCTLRPTVKGKNGKEKGSKLFDDLMRMSDDREFTIGVYVLSQTDMFHRKFPDLKRDENGEYLASELDKAMGLREMMKGEAYPRMALDDLGAIGKDGNKKVYSTVDEIAGKVIEYNNTHPKTVVTMERTEKGYVLNAERKSFSNADSNINLAFGTELLTRMRGLLRQLGFDVSFMDNAEYNGVFNPAQARETVDGLISIIQMSNSEQGAAALPEEIVHALVAGLEDHPLVQRLRSLLSSEEALRNVLGDQYDAYNKMYDGDMKRMVSEAMGKLVTDQITGQTSDYQQQTVERTLAQRIWDWIKSLFSRTSVKDMQNMIDQARQTASELAGSIMDESILSLVDADQILSSESLYSLGKQISNEQKVLDAAVDGLAKLTNLKYEIRTSGEENTKKRAATIENMQNRIDSATIVSGHIDIGDAIEGIYDLAKQALSDLSEIQDTLTSHENQQYFTPDASIEDILASSHVTHDLETYVRTYKDYFESIRTLLLDLVEKDPNLRSSFERLGLLGNNSLIDNILVTMLNLSDNYANLKWQLCYSFLSHFWKGDITIEFGPMKGQTLTLQMLMNQMTKGYGPLDTWLYSMSTGSDGFLSLVAYAYKNFMYDRDEELLAYSKKMNALEAWREKKGFKSDFMMERDKDGKLTGRYISTIDFDAYKKKRDEMIDLARQTAEDNDQPFDGAYYKEAMKMIDDQLTEIVELEYNGEKYYERMPKFSLFHKEGAKHLFDYDSLGLTQDQKSYYTQALSYKMMHDQMIHTGLHSTKLFLAPQVRKDEMEIATDNPLHPIRGVKQAWARFKNRYIVSTSEDIELGALDTEDLDKDMTVMTDNELANKSLRDRIKSHFIRSKLDGTRLRGVPIYYNTKIKDTDNLSTDVGSSLLTYGAMAINYKRMNSIVDMFQIIRDVNNERRIFSHAEMKNSDALSESFEILGMAFSKRTMDNIFSLTKKGQHKVLDDFIRGGLYGIFRNNDGVIGKVNTAKLLDGLRNYHSKLTLGLNAMSGMSNLIAGKMQSFIESMSGEYFGFGDFIWAQKEYAKYAVGALVDTGRSNPHNFLTLMMQEFDANYELNNHLKYNKYYNGGLERFLGRNSILLAFMSMGEYQLHAENFISLCHRQKVLLNGKRINLWDAYERYDLKTQVASDMDDEMTEYGVRLKKGVTDLEGNALVNDDGSYTDAFLKLRRDHKSKVRYVGQMCQGALSQVDLGRLSRYASGRCVMNFRQWMVRHFQRRYSSARYNAETHEITEGFYRSSGRVIWNNTIGRLTHNLTKDSEALEKYVALYGNKLSSKEKSNLRRMFTELLTFVAENLVYTLFMDDASWGFTGKYANKSQRIVAYCMLREIKEISNFMPTPFLVPVEGWNGGSILTNAVYMLENPISASQSFNILYNLIKIWDIAETASPQSRYAGMNKYESYVLKAIPGYNNIVKQKKFITGEENSMFTPYKEN